MRQGYKVDRAAPWYKWSPTWLAATTAAEPGTSIPSPQSSFDPHSPAHHMLSATEAPALPGGCSPARSQHRRPPPRSHHRPPAQGRLTPSQTTNAAHPPWPAEAEKSASDADTSILEERMEQLERAVGLLQNNYDGELARLQRTLEQEQQNRVAERAHAETLLDELRAQFATIHSNVVTLTQCIRMLEVRTSPSDAVSAGDLQFLELKSTLVGISQRQEAFQAQLEQLHKFYEPRLTDLRELRFEIDLLKRRMQDWHQPPPISMPPASGIGWPGRGDGPQHTTAPTSSPHRRFTSLVPSTAPALRSSSPGASLRLLDVPQHETIASSLSFSKPVPPPIVRDPMLGQLLQPGATTTTTTTTTTTAAPASSGAHTPTRPSLVPTGRPPEMTQQATIGGVEHSPSSLARELTMLQHRLSKLPQR
eukprot:GGOE01018332.1.p1 GENE.GGOE01018332.1~~GGOE01018332.1.p1  ORF type:complete len:421 (-),score=57.59 GGOE01018332.1:310-1572(-)